MKQRLGSGIMLLAGSLLVLGACSGSDEPLLTRDDSASVETERPEFNGETPTPAADGTTDDGRPAPQEQGGNLDAEQADFSVGAMGASANDAAGVPLAPTTTQPPPDEVSGDRFDAPGTNPFVMVGHDPLSTFAVDVDTASYDLFRRDVEDGVLPNATSVRLEEYVNYFHYDYPAAEPDAEVPFSISLAGAQTSAEAGRALVRVGIVGKQPPPKETKPANLVFLVDVSGSMRNSDKLPLVQQVLTQTLDLLQDTDTVSIVTYASDTGVRLEPTKVSDRATIVQQIEGLSASGSTAGASGINLAYEQAQAGFIEGGINHVILATDGDFNVGVSSNAGLVALIEDKRRSGITFTALGFGSGNLNDAMLEAISNAGNGFYGVISSEEQAADYVEQRMLSTLSLIAKDVKIQVEFNAAQVQAYRLLGYENRAIADQDFRNDVVDAGEIGAGHQVTALYEVVLTGGQLPAVDGAPEATNGDAYDGAVEVGVDDLMMVKVRYKHVDATEEDAALEVSSSLLPADLAADLAAADADLAWAASVAAFAEILKGSPYADPAAVDAIEAVVAAQSERDDDRAEFATLFEAARGML